MKSLRFWAMAGVLAASTAAHAVPSISNGSFEQTLTDFTVADGQLASFVNGWGNWYVSGNGLEKVRDPLASDPAPRGFVPDGSQYAVLLPGLHYDTCGCTPSGSIDLYGYIRQAPSQPFTVGQQYVLHFMSFGEGDAFAYGANAGPVVQGRQAYSTGGWVQHAYTFTANDQWMNVEFRGPAWDVETNFNVDSVYITAVPEPETYALMLVGLCAVAVMSRRRVK